MIILKYLNQQITPFQREKIKNYSKLVVFFKNLHLKNHLARKDEINIETFSNNKSGATIKKFQVVDLNLYLLRNPLNIIELFILILF